MKRLVFEDDRAAERNSHGVFLVRCPSEFGSNILFYCAEWNWLWADIHDVGDPGRALELNPKRLIFVDENDFLPETVARKASYMLEKGEHEDRRFSYAPKEQVLKKED